jgi:hypothetical protein
MYGFAAIVFILSLINDIDVTITTKSKTLLYHYVIQKVK